MSDVSTLLLQHLSAFQAAAFSFAKLFPATDLCVLGVSIAIAMSPGKKRRARKSVGTPRLKPGSPGGPKKARNAMSSPRKGRRPSLAKSPPKSAAAGNTSTTKKRKRKSLAAVEVAVTPSPKPRVKRKLHLSVLETGVDEDEAAAEGESKTGATESIAKGVFVFRANKEKTAAKERDSLDLPEFFQDTWQHAEDSFSRIMKSMFSDVLRGVAGFANKNSGLAADPGCKVIPTCALLMGVNLPDHEDLFGLLGTELRGSVSPHVASVRSGSIGGSSTGTGLLHLVQSVVRQLMTASKAIADDDESSTEDDEAANNEDGLADLKKARLVSSN